MDVKTLRKRYDSLSQELDKIYDKLEEVRQLMREVCTHPKKQIVEGVNGFEGHGFPALPDFRVCKQCGMSETKLIAYGMKEGTDPYYRLSGENIKQIPYYKAKEHVID